MKKVFVDTNIILDMLAKRATHFEHASNLFTLADKGKIIPYISVLSIANTNYILCKQLSQTKAKEILRQFMVLVEVVNLDDKIVDLALSDEKFKDFENGLQYYSALESRVDVIITRNQKDFKNSILPVQTANEFLASLNT